MQSFFQPRTPIEAIDYHVDRLRDLIKLVSDTKLYFSKSDLYFLNDYTPSSIRKHFDNGQIEQYHLNKLCGIFFQAIAALEFLKEPDEKHFAALTSSHFEVLGKIPAIENDLKKIACHSPLKNLSFKQLMELENAFTKNVAKSSSGLDTLRCAMFKSTDKLFSKLEDEFSKFKNERYKCEEKDQIAHDIIRMVAEHDDAKLLMKVVYEKYIKDKRYYLVHWNGIEKYIFNDAELEDMLENHGWHKPYQFNDYRR
ncbi:MAG TPA: hypothetical protein VL360_02000 [Gammaproteobacteria bacterium]|nr:hypothetical protein [Gammaproteobacteria bacterium]